MLKKILLSLVFYLLAALGMSLTIKADIGISSFNALNVTVSEWLHIKVGTVTGCLNGLFLIFSYFIDAKRDKKEYACMILSVMFFSYAINIFVYKLLFHFTSTVYSVNVGIFILGTCLGGIGTGRILHYNVLKFPIEKCCQQLEKVTQKSFSFLDMLLIFAVLPYLCCSL